MHRVQPRELRDGLLVVVDAQVDERVAQSRVAAVLLDDEQRCRLLAAAVAAGRLGGREALEQALRERLSVRGRERRCQRGDRLLADEDVALSGEARPGESARPFHARGARVGGAAAVGVDDADLAVGTAVVRVGQAGDHLRGGEALGAAAASP